MASVGQAQNAVEDGAWTCDSDTIPHLPEKGYQLAESQALVESKEPHPAHCRGRDKRLPARGYTAPAPVD